MPNADDDDDVLPAPASDAAAFLAITTRPRTASLLCARAYACLPTSEPPPCFAPICHRPPPQPPPPGGGRGSRRRAQTFTHHQHSSLLPCCLAFFCWVWMISLAFHTQTTSAEERSKNTHSHKTTTTHALPHPPPSKKAHACTHKNGACAPTTTGN